MNWSNFWIVFWLVLKFVAFLVVVGVIATLFEHITRTRKMMTFTDRIIRERREFEEYHKRRNEL